MTTIQDAPRYASPVDYQAYGEYGPGRGFERGQAFQRPRYRFQGRITADGSSGYRAEPGRYHLYISWGCPWAQRTAIVRKLMGLDDVVSLSYVDDVRDGRGQPAPPRGPCSLGRGWRGEPEGGTDVSIVPGSTASLGVALYVANGRRSQRLGDFLNLIAPFVEVAHVGVAARQFYDGEAH